MPSRRKSPRPTAYGLAALASAALLAGCSTADPGEPGAEETAASPAREVLLQPASAQGPAPFTPSTAQEGAPVREDAPPVTDVAAPAPEGHSLTGATPGLYGGTRALASCNVEQQAAYLTAEPAKTRAFAESAGIPEGNLAGWLRGLTPVLLRADTRVTSHGYRDGRATAYQSVLQAGTAVLVDQYGTPRVRCACGNPLRSPADARDARHTGEPWAGYRPDRVVVITPTSTVVTRLVIASAADNTWLERRTGSDGEQDRRPDVLPPCAPASCDLVADPPAPLPDGPAPADPPATTRPPGPGRPTGPSDRPSPATPEAPGEPAPHDEPVAPPAPDGGTTVPTPDAPAEPDVPGVPDGPGEQPVPEPPPSFEEAFPAETVPDQPETFEG
ncbi:DUF6777-containing protein [Streptomyces roseicoloratus]|uniref:DUF6777-containing protein n=1 Tax=Streptomyces roseicoloratus TaxID=2508722 RepID=A0ABY9RQA9_9ACTN|nr:DUF6777 domain-containing protein [Streptomyces roseicoloratus]WMX43928.1 DUF6777-containing protein [Streptomyces roseicoloratus]